MHITPTEARQLHREALEAVDCSWLDAWDIRPAELLLLLTSGRKPAGLARHLSTRAGLQYSPALDDGAVTFLEDYLDGALQLGWLALDYVTQDGVTELVPVLTAAGRSA